MKLFYVVGALLSVIRPVLAADEKPTSLKPVAVEEMTVEQLRQVAKQFLEDRNSDGRANFQAACINVARDVELKDLLVYAVAPIRSHSFRTNGFVVRVVSDSDISRSHRKWAGTYPNHHNALVLNFAAAQFATGDKELALALIHTLAKAQPDCEWSSPERNIPIMDIVKGLEAGGKGPVMEWFLKAESEEWARRSKLYRQFNPRHQQ